MKNTFGTGMAPADSIKQAIKAVPPKARKAASNKVAASLKAAIAAKQAGAVPPAAGMAPPPPGAAPVGPPMPGMAKGGEVDSKAMMDKEIAVFKKAGRKDLVKHEMAEKKAKGYAKGGGVESKGKTKGKHFAAGGAVRGVGIARKGGGKGKIC